MWFDETEDEQAFGGFGAPQQAAQPRQSLFGLDSMGDQDKRLFQAMLLMGMGQQLQNPGNPSNMLGLIQSLGQMRGQQQKLGLQQQKLDQEKALQEQLSGIFQPGPQPPAGGSNFPDPGQGDWGPDPAAPVSGAPNAASPNKQRADMYRRAADLMARSGNDEAAKRYHDIAAGLDPVAPAEKWDATPRKEIDPATGKPVLAIYSDQGNRKVVEGALPTANLTAPTATASGMMSLDQDTGEMRDLGVQPHEGRTADQKDYELAVQSGAFKGSFMDYQRTMANLKAPKISNTTHLSPVVRVGNTLGENIAEIVAKNAMTAIEKGESAVETLDQIDEVRKNVDNAITGPLNEPRTVFARIKSMITGNKATKEQLAATARTMQGMAQLELTAAEAMKGQGQITEFERALIAKTAAGKLSNDPAEIIAATEALEKVSRLRIRQGQRGNATIKSVPDFRPLYPFVDNSKLTNQPPGGRAITPARKPGERARSASGPVTNAPAQAPAAPPAQADLRNAAQRELERRRKAQGGR